MLYQYFPFENKEMYFLLCEKKAKQNLSRKEYLLSECQNASKVFHWIYIERIFFSIRMKEEAEGKEVNQYRHQTKKCTNIDTKQCSPVSITIFFDKTLSPQQR